MLCISLDGSRVAVEFEMMAPCCVPELGAADDDNNDDEVVDCNRDGMKEVETVEEGGQALTVSARTTSCDPSW